MLLSHKSLLAIFIVGCAFLSHCTCAPFGYSTGDATPGSNLQSANLKKSDQASQLELPVSLLPDKSTIPTHIDINIEARPSDTGRNGGQTQPPNDDNEMPEWLVMYIEFITWIWTLVASIVTWIIRNVLPVIFFGAACTVTGIIVVGIAFGLVGLTRAVVTGPTERTPLNRPRQ